MIKHSANDMASEQVDRLVAKCAQEKNIVSEAALYELKLAVEAYYGWRNHDVYRRVWCTKRT